jgi:hypothetical protein
MRDRKFSVGDEVVLLDSRRMNVSAVQLVSKVLKNGNFTIGDSRDQYNPSGFRAGRGHEWSTVSVYHADSPAVDRARRWTIFNSLASRLRRMADRVGQTAPGGEDVPSSTLKALSTALDDMDAKLREMGWSG